jgi:hypothetical protein
LKTSETLCLDHFYIMVSKEQFQELAMLKNFINGLIHKKIKVKGDSWEGIYLRTNSGEYIEFMQPKIGHYEGIGIAFSSKSPIFADVRNLKQEFSKLKWINGTRIWPDGSKWFTWLSIKSKAIEKRFEPYFTSWSMFYHPRYHQHKSVSKKINKPHSIARICQLHTLMNPCLEKFVRHHLKWTNAQIISTHKGMKIIIPNREFEDFVIHITFSDKCESFLFKKIVLETHRMKKIKLPKLKSIKLTQKNGIITMGNR